MIDIVHHADPGPRPNMEDAYAAAVLEIFAPNPRWCAVAALCDGVGGANAGEVASNAVSHTLVSALIAGVQALMFTSPQSQTAPDSVLELLQDSLIEANDLVLEKSRQTAECAGMATTVVCAIAVDDLLYIGWAGDSRAYLYREGELHRLTCDHSQVEELVLAGEISREQARNHPALHTITQYLGKEREFRSETQVIHLRPDDVVCMCSDGLTDVLNDQQIVERLRQWENDGGSIDQWPARLVNDALATFTNDNTSVLFLRFQGDVATSDAPVITAATAHYSRLLSRMFSHITRR